MGQAAFGSEVINFNVKVEFCYAAVDNIFEAIVIRGHLIMMEV